MGLPILVDDPATAACSTCPARCCEHTVPLTGYDVVRLTRALALPWRVVAGLGSHRIALFEGFRLDRGPTHWFFHLRKRDDGACQFLLELPDGYRRCGVHALRPGACRVYPLVPDLARGGEFGNHALCPDPQRALYEGAIPQLRDGIDEDQAERALYARVRARWDLVPMRVPVERPLDADVFVDWIGKVYDAIAPLRIGERGQWQLAAYELVADFPLPQR